MLSPVEQGAQHRADAQLQVVAVNQFGFEQFRIPLSAERGHLKPVGEWNSEEIYANGPHIVVTLNGDLSGFVGDGPGNVTAFNPQTGEKIGDSIVVGKGPTSVIVIPK